ncbi:hypothetical protein V6N11_006527 [Hibiscus sabdariffa]|uniref:Uncharacterized protein n=1 Tax=Hibiscus sabdariffa TaxID=183260 RepID=A0ABR2RR37_9ROSI
MEVSSTVNLAPYVPSENITSARASQYQQNPASVAPSNERNPNPIGWPKNCSDTSLGTYIHIRSPRSRDNHCTPEGSLNARLNAPSPPDQCSTMVSATIVEEFAVSPEDVEVLFTAAPPHVTIEFCPGEDGCNAKRPIELIVDGNVADAKIVVFGFTSGSSDRAVTSDHIVQNVKTNKSLDNMLCTISCTTYNLPCFVWARYYDGARTIQASSTYPSDTDIQWPIIPLDGPCLNVDGGVSPSTAMEVLFTIRVENDLGIPRLIVQSDGMEALKLIQEPTSSHSSISLVRVIATMVEKD